MLGWMKHKLGIKVARKNTNNLRYADDTTLMAESEEELKSLLMKVKEESETKIMASVPITSWQIDGETMETVRDFIFGGSNMTSDCDCSHEIKKCLLLGRKAMTNPNNILKSRDITLATNVHLVKAMVLPVQLSSVQLFSHVRLFVTPRTAACKASLSITNSWSPPKPMSIELMMPFISSSVVPFSSCPQYFPASGSFPMSQLFTSGGQSIGASASTSVPPMNIQD